MGENHQAFVVFGVAGLYVMAGLISTLFCWKVGDLGFYDRADFYMKWALWPILLPFGIVKFIKDSKS